MREKLIRLLTGNCLSHKEIGEILGLSAQKVTVLVEELEQDGFIIRVGRNFYRRKVDVHSLGKGMVHIESYAAGAVEVRHGHYIEYSESGAVKKVRLFFDGKEVSL